MVRPCAKYARLDCYAPLQVTAKHLPSLGAAYSHTRSSLLFGLGTGTCKIKYFYRNCCAPKTSDGKSVVGIFSACLIHAPRYYYGLVLGRIGGVCYAVASPRRQLKTAEGIDHFSSALPLGRGTFHRFERLVCALLRFRERSRTIKVQLATSSSQNHRKSFTQSCLVLSIKYRH